MPFNTYIKNTINYYICALILLVSIVSGHRCYICGFESNLTNCDKFDPTNEKLFAKECPDNYMGCSIQKNDTHTVRSCEDIKLNDCKKANHVEYCYCSTDLCNGLNIIFGNGQNIPPDDEDSMNEGSGSNVLIRETTAIPSILTETTKSTSKGIMLKSYFTFLLIFLLL